MTETLSAQEIQELRTAINIDSLNFSEEDFKKALNTIEARDKEIEALKGQVAALSLNAPRPDDYKQHAGCYIQEHWDEDSFNKTKWTHYDGNSWSAYRDNCDCGAFQRLKNTKATAEAFIAKERADEREKAIRECISIIQSAPNIQTLKGDGYIKECYLGPDEKLAIESLLTKVQA